MAKKSNPQDQLVNLQAQQLAAQVANWAAQLEFQKERFRLLEMPEFQQGYQLEVDKFAWAKAEGEWKRAFEEASLTGTYNGQPTTQWLTEQARLTGVLNGQQTLEGKLTDAQVAQMNSRMKLENDQFISTTTGYFNGQKTFERERWEGEQGLQGLQLLASLQGPGNAFKQMRVLGAMGANQQAMQQAWAGQFAVAGSGGTGASPGQAQISDLWLGAGGGTYAPGGPAVGSTPSFRGVTGVPTGTGTWANATTPGGVDTNMYFNGTGPVYQNPQQYNAPQEGGHGWANTMPINPYGVPPGWMAPYAPAATPDPYAQPSPTPVASPDTPAYTYSPAGVQAPVGAWNYQPAGMGEVQAVPPGMPSNPATADVSSSTPMSPGAASTLLNQSTYNPYAAGTAATGELMPNQINAENYANMNIYAKKLGWAEFENRGWDTEAAQDAFKRSLPKYGGPEKGTVAGF